MAYKSFHGSVPDDRLYCVRYDMWVLRRGDEVRMGATSFGLYLAGEVIAFTAKPKGAEIGIGRGMGTVECRKTVLAVHSPISFVLLEGNEAAEERPGLINRSPYTEGWMVRARPTSWLDDLPHLVDALKYRQHVLSVEPDAQFND